MESKKLVSLDYQDIYFKSESQIFEEVMKNELPYFVEVHEEAMRMMLKSRSELGPRYFNKNWNANEVNSKIQGLLFDKFPDNMSMTKDGRFYFTKNENYVILFKKLSTDFYPENIRTRASNAILLQKSLDFSLPVVFVGYVPSSTWDSYKHIMAVYISNNTIVWKSDLNAVINGYPAIQFSAFDMNNNNELDEPQVTIK